MLELNQIICGDCIDVMKSIGSESVDMIITSPPYNVGIDYDHHQDSMEWTDYLKLLKTVWVACYDILKPGGRIAVNIANAGRNPFISSSSNITQQLCQIGFQLRGYVYWDKGVHEQTTAWGSWLSASNPVLTNDMETIIIAHKSTPKIQHNGKSTITKKEFLEYTQCRWQMRPELSKYNKHPAPFPEELPRRLIRLYTYVGDVVLDPFCGSGTTPFIAKMEGAQIHRNRYIEKIL